MITTTSITWVVAFAAGLVSFLSPCVMPLVPSYLAYLAGSTPPYQATRARMFMSGLMFAVGFSSVFALVGVLLNTVLAHVAYDAQYWMSRIGGAVMILFGLYVMGVFSIPALERQRIVRVLPFKSQFISSFLFGAAFAVGWTPCVGAVLGAVLGLAATRPGEAFMLLLMYAIGFSTPFVLAGGFAAQVNKVLYRFNGLSRGSMIFFGAFLVLVGVFIFIQRLGAIANIDAILGYFTGGGQL